MTLLILGKLGQVGWELQRALASRFPIVAWGREELDLTSLAAVADKIERLSPQIIVNAVAYTAVDDAETHADEARLVNADLVGVLARSAAALDARLVHYSTDYVFDGVKTGPYSEVDAPNPQGVYARTKMAGEEAVVASGCRYLILRTSWLHSTRRRNFARAVLRLAESGAPIRMIHDRVGAPTSAELIADVTGLILDRMPQDRSADGIYHVTSDGVTNWYAYARHIVETARRYGADFVAGPEAIQSVSADDFPTPAPRPSNSVLDTAKVKRAFGVTLPPWRQGVERTVAELVEGKRHA